MASAKRRSPEVHAASTGEPWGRWEKLDPGPWSVQFPGLFPGESPHEFEVSCCCRYGGGGPIGCAGTGPAVYQYPDRRHVRRVLPVGCRDWKDLRRQDSSRQNAGAGNKGLGRKPDPAAAGRGELAFTLGDSLKAAWEGDEEAGFRSKLDKLRIIGAIYPNYIQIVATADSGIKTLADLKGKSLSVGAPKSGTELNSRAILAAAGLSYKDMGKVEYLPFAESVDLMKNRQLNATLQSAGLGVASLKDLSASTEITVVSVPKQVVDKIGPPFVSVMIPANTYNGQEKDVPTAAVVNYLVTSSAVSDDLAYKMTKLIFESLPELANAHAAGKEIKLETAATGGPVPLHPGAIRYYKEKGLIK